MQIIGLKKIIPLVLFLAFVSSNVSAQSSLKSRQSEIGRSGLSTKSASGLSGSTKGLIMGGADAMTSPIQNDKYVDTGLKELEKQMEERDWASESTAWERACKIGSLEAFQKYSAIYPNGEHMPEASVKIIELKVEELLRGAHNPLPGLICVEPDEDSPTSTITIGNNTAYPLTVMFSGETVESITISSGRTASITVANGEYRIAASVPPSAIKPFAGIGTVQGGRYEVGFWVNSGTPVQNNSTWIHQTNR